MWFWGKQILMFINQIMRHVTSLVSHPKQISFLITVSFAQKYWQMSKLSDMKNERLTEIGLPETVKSFVWQNLSPNNEQISFNCRELRRKGHIYSTWFYSGPVFIKKCLADGESIKIHHLNQLPCLSGFQVCVSKR